MAKPDSKVQKKCQMRRSLSPQVVLISQGSHWERWGESPPTLTMSEMHPNKTRPPRSCLTTVICLWETQTWPCIWKLRRSLLKVSWEQWGERYMAYTRVRQDSWLWARETNHCFLWDNSRGSHNLCLAHGWGPLQARPMTPSMSGSWSG